MGNSEYCLHTEPGRLTIEYAPDYTACLKATIHTDVCVVCILAYIQQQLHRCDVVIIVVKPGSC